MQVSIQQLDQALDAFNTFGFTVEREGTKGIVVFDNVLCLHKLRDQWRVTDEFFTGLTVQQDGELVLVELGTLH